MRLENPVCNYPECASSFAPYVLTARGGQPNGVRLSNDAYLCPEHKMLHTSACERLPLAVQELQALAQLIPDSYKSRNMEAIAATLPSDDIWHDIVRARKRVKEIRTILSNCRDNL